MMACSERCPMLPVVHWMTRSGCSWLHTIFGCGAPAVVAPSKPVTDVTVRTANDDDWPQISLLEAAGFGSFTHPHQVEAIRTLVPPDGAVVACAGGG